MCVIYFKFALHELKKSLDGQVTREDESLFFVMVIAAVG